MKKFAVSLKNFKFTAFSRPDGSLQLERPVKPDVDGKLVEIEGYGGSTLHTTPVIVYALTAAEARQKFEDAMGISGVSSSLPRGAYSIEPFSDELHIKYDKQGNRERMLMLGEPLKSK